MNTIKLLLALAISTSILSCSKEEDEIIELIEEEIETPSSEVKYSGHWSSTLPQKTYDKISISLKITPEEDSNSWTGEFFFTAGYVPCCNGEANNGTLTLTIENDVVTSFKYDDTIPGCPGIFEGSGQINEDILEINFSGSDCEGEHKDGKMVLTKAQ